MSCERSSSVHMSVLSSPFQPKTTMKTPLRDTVSPTKRCHFPPPRLRDPQVTSMLVMAHHPERTSCPSKSRTKLQPRPVRSPRSFHSSRHPRRAQHIHQTPPRARLHPCSSVTAGQDRGATIRIRRGWNTVCPGGDEDESRAREVCGRAGECVDPSLHLSLRIQ